MKTTEDRQREAEVANRHYDRIRALGNRVTELERVVLGLKAEIAELRR